MPVVNELKRLQRDYPDLDIEFIEVTGHPIRAWKDGIRGIPSVRIGDDILTKFLLTADKVRAFVGSHLKDTAKSNTDESA